MKNKRNIWFILIGVLIVIIIGFLIFKKKENNHDKSLLIVNSYSNYAWSISYSGTAIFGDGTIYRWNFNGNTKEEYNKFIGNNDINTKEGFENFIIEKGNMNIKKVPSDNLERIKELINNLNTNNISFELDCHGADMGSSIISVFRNDGEYIIAEYGDCDGESKSSDVQELLNLIKDNM